jgi:putative heme-binding domain-containing protein
MFQRNILGHEPGTGRSTVVCSGDFVFVVNGKRVGEGKPGKVYRFSLSGIVERGDNDFRILVKHESGSAGLFIDAEIRGQSGHAISCDTDARWRALVGANVDALTAPLPEDAANWTACRDLGPHAESPWNELVLTGGPLDQFEVAPGFELQQIATKEQVGSLVAMTWGNRGRLFVSRENGPVQVCIDDNGDGVYDRVSEYSPAVTNCQGLCTVGNDLYVVGNGPNSAGIYRLPDANHDDVADFVEHISATDGGMGEHGPHDIVLGPDGWLYFNLGNHAWIRHPAEPTSPVRNYEEGYALLPKFEDAGGHAVGIPAPGGTIWRFSPDGKRWFLETVGFRNHYDIAFNSAGDLFTFDSDMEWDVNLPWYRPVRVNHCVQGAEFGWRSGAAVWPDEYFDSLPTTIDVGRGSPTGVVFYEHTAFPKDYHGAFLCCDWSLGRLIAARMTRKGATYAGDFVNLVTGNPLNVSDVEVDRDGSVVFCTGGRNTAGGIYRLKYVGEGATASGPVAADSMADLFALPQMTSAWARELAATVKANLGDEAWMNGIQRALNGGNAAQKVRALTLLSQFGPKPSFVQLKAAAADDSVEVRQFAAWLLGDHPRDETAAFLTERLGVENDPTVLRRIYAAFVRAGLQAPIRACVRDMGHSDRWLRFSARIALERVPVEQWKAAVTGARGFALTEGCLALYRNNALTLAEAEAAIRPALQSFETSPDRDTLRLHLLRLTQLLALRNDPRSAAVRGTIGRLERILSQWSEGASSDNPVTRRIGWEAMRVLAMLDSAAVNPIAVRMLSASHRETQMHAALCLRYLSGGWTPEGKQRLLDWYETTEPWLGGNSLQGYLRNIVAATLEHFSPEERRDLLAVWKQRPHASRLLLQYSEPAQLADFDATVSTVIREADAMPNRRELANLAIDALGRSSGEAAQALLRTLYDSDADRRDLLARAIAKQSIPANAPYLLRGVLTGDNTTKQLCLNALLGSDIRLESASDFQTVIVAGLKLGRQGGGVAVKLLAKQTGEAPPHGDTPESLPFYQQWYHERFPNAPAAELPTDDPSKSKYTFAQLVDFLDRNPAGQAGDVARGKAVFTKVNCVKCHRFAGEGEGIGPDLSTLRRRFQRREIVESVLYPSQVISDQFAAVTVVTKAGLTHTGMPIPNQGAGKLVLLLSDATRLEIAESDVEEKMTAKASVMPEGLFNTLSMEEIADLFAYLETSRQAPEPMPETASNR